MYPVPINNIDDRFAWKFTSDNEFSVKIAKWANNDSVRPHPKAKSINGIWKLNLILKVKFFACKLARNIL